MGHSIESSSSDDNVGIYECEVRLKFRIIEEALTMSNRDSLIETLVDAFAYGSDEYLEALDSQVDIQKLKEMEASPEMRRQLIRLRNSNRLA
ncbi:MAG: Npun_R1517 family heterocyst differentiation transcriptional regulator [Cyanobacteria bacterium P01_A01_bin.114]